MEQAKRDGRRSGVAGHFISPAFHSYLLAPASHIPILITLKTSSFVRRASIERQMMAMESLAGPSLLDAQACDFGRPRSHSEGAAFQNSFDYTIPYEEYDGKNGADLALELLGAHDAPFDAAGQLRVPFWVGKHLAYPPVPASLANDIKREPSKAAKRAVQKMGLSEDGAIDGIEELAFLSKVDHIRSLSDSNEAIGSTDRFVPRIISELVEDNLVPKQYAALPPEEIAKMFQINPRASPRPKPNEQTISYSINAEGRTIIEYATLPQIVRAYASDAQGTSKFSVFFIISLFISGF